MTMDDFITENYDWTKPKETLDKMKDKIITAMEKEQDWYVTFRGIHSFFSRTIRLFSIVLFALGILWPIIKTQFLELKPTIDIGYISLAIGGLLLLLDKYLGVTSGYVRFYIAELDIKKNTFDFIENWNIESARVDTTKTITPENIIVFLNLIKSYRQAVFTIIQLETSSWATEFQSQTGELYELFKQKQSEYIKQSNISVSIENYIGYSGIEITIDEQEPWIKLNEMTSYIFRNVSIKPHTILIHGKNENGKIITVSKNVDVIGDKTVDVVLGLP
jgi:hypothetical protein